jgi:tRNA(Ile)-lysidine synthase
VLGAEVVEAPGATEEELRGLRYSFATDRLRATGHTASDQVETVLYRLVSSGSARGMKVRREDGVVRPLLTVWRHETEAYCRSVGLEFRTDVTNPDTKRGLIREAILPLLRLLDDRAEKNLLALGQERPRLPRRLEAALAELLATHAGTKSVDLGHGIRAVREYDRLRLEGAVRWGPWVLESRREGLEVRARQPGDRLAGRTKKLQDLFVDAKVPRAQRESWPVVVNEQDEVVFVPGVAAAPGYEDAVSARIDE